MSVAGSETPLVQDEHARPMALPADPALCHEIIAKLLEQLTAAQTKALKLERELEALKRGIWGRKSEKLDANQLQMFVDLLAAQGVSLAPVEAGTAEAQAKPEPKQNGTSRRKKRGGGRSLIPPDLPREIVWHRLSEQEKRCPTCGLLRRTIGYESSEQLEIIPARLIVREHRRETGFCEECEGEFATADKPASPIEKCAAGPGLLAHVVVSKVDDHLPVYRQCEILKRHGIEVPRPTMGRWLLMTALVLRCLYELMLVRVKSSKVIHTDETAMPVLEKGQTHKGRMWVYLGDTANPYVVYAYTRTKESKGPRDWLRGFHGFLQADAYPGFDQLYVPDVATGTQVTEVACWAHARRKFESIKMNFPAQALTALGFIRKLYKIEESARLMSPRRRRTLRRKEARPILDEFKAWLNEAALQELPNSELGKAIRYVLSNWEALTRYVNIGRLSIDNNAAERALRVVAVGRKNWIFAGHDEGAEAMAMLFTMVESAKRAGLNPEVWLRDVLTRIADTPVNELEDLLPDRWKQRQVPSARHAMDVVRRKAQAVAVA